MNQDLNLECYKCTTKAEFKGTQAVSAAYATGWRTHNGRDMCPECFAKWMKKKTRYEVPL